MPYEDLTPSIIKIRELCNEEYVKNPDYYYKEDVERLNNEDWLITRFLLRQKKKIGPTFEMIKTTLRWRKQFGFQSLKETDFPQEFYRMGGMIQYEKDLYGNGMVYMRVKMRKNFGALDDLIIRYVVYILNKVEEEMDGRGMVLVFDCQDAGISNADMSTLWLLVTILVKYYPKGLSYVLIYELPWILNAVVKTVLSVIPSEQIKTIKFANKKDKTNYVALENLPDFMGGTCDRDYRIVPKQCPTAEELAKQKGVSDKEVKRLMKTIKSLLNESPKAIADL